MIFIIPVETESIEKSHVKITSCRQLGVQMKAHKEKNKQ